MKSQTLSIGTKIIDLGWPWMAETHSIAEEMHLLEHTAHIWMKLNPYHQRQKCKPMTHWPTYFPTYLPLIVWTMTIFSGNTSCPEKKPQFSLNNFNKYRHSFVIVGTNHPEDSFYQENRKCILHIITVSDDAIVTSLVTTLSCTASGKDTTIFCLIVTFES